MADPTAAPEAEQAEAPAKLGWRERYEKLLAEFGLTAAVVWFGLWFGSMAVFYVLIGMGFEFGEGVGEAGRVGAAYLASQAIKPLRIAATLTLTPLIAGLRHRWSATDPRADD